MKLHTFPEKGISKFAILKRLYNIKQQLRQRDIKNNLGWLYTLPHAAAVRTYQYFLDQNPNHLGNWSIPASKPWATQELEQEVISMIINLYHAPRENLEGYITSGGTEANLFSSWIGRKYLENCCEKTNICLLKTSLTHYSIQKCTDIINIPEFLVPLNANEWNIDQRGLEKTVAKLYREKYRGFLLPLTLGYTQTGTSDNIEMTTRTLERLRKLHPDISFFVWVDAALNGLILPFLETTFAPFSSPWIQTVLVDFHKFGLIPYPAGIVLYQKQLRKLIEKPIDYLPETDSTVLGSRPGMPAASIWTMIQVFGKNGYRKLVHKQLLNKNHFLTQLETLPIKTRVITHKYSLSCGILFSSLTHHKLPKYMEEKYGLFIKKTRLFFYPTTWKTVSLYKFFFLPHVDYRVVNEFLTDLKSLIF